MRDDGQRKVQKVLHQGAKRPKTEMGGPVLDESALRQRNWCLDAKGIRKRARGALVVCLVPARTDTKWWHEYAAKGEVTFVRGRLKFGGQKNSAPFPSAIVVFEPKGEKV